MRISVEEDTMGRRTDVSPVVLVLLFVQSIVATSSVRP